MAGQLNDDEVAMVAMTAISMASCKPMRTPFAPGTIIDASQPIPDNPYRNIVGSLTFLAATTRPDLAFTASFLARWNHQPNESVLKIAKRALRYCQGTRHYGIFFQSSTNLERTARLALVDHAVGAVGLAHGSRS
mmetsp:Transcript_12468/g.52433  ORF Transcript_12468/g.52433 Transcript_12468/m.52433 type:complete len:135 (-) Transcript_12468:1947-2351(-)